MTDLTPPPSRHPSVGILERLPPLSWRRSDDPGLIRVRGPDARSFLQSQLSNDVAQVSATQSQLSGYCGPKGRLLAVFSVLQLESPDSFGLELPVELLPATLKRLRMFVLRSKLVLDDASAEWPALALAGPGAADALQRLDLSVPGESLTTATGDDVLIVRRPGIWPRYLLRAAPARLAAIEQALAALPPLSDDHWRLAELLAGVPVVRAATVEHFVPQTVDLDLAGGISFSKGCYPGQEIVARVHYLGRLKQRLHLADCDRPVAAGQVVRLGDGDGYGDGQAIGEVVDSAPLPGGSFLLSLALQLERPPGATLLAGDDAPSKLTQVRPAH